MCENLLLKIHAVDMATSSTGNWADERMNMY
jgi:hypothetical protein